MLTSMQKQLACGAVFAQVRLLERQNLFRPLRPGGEFRKGAPIWTFDKVRVSLRRHLL